MARSWLGKQRHLYVPWKCRKLCAVPQVLGSRVEELFRKVGSFREECLIIRMLPLGILVSDLMVSL